MIKPHTSFPENESMLMEDEHTIDVVHRHPIGLIFIYLASLISIAAIFSVLILFGSGLRKNVSTQTFNTIVALSLMAAGILAIVLVIATYLYRQNRFALTDKSLVQTLQKGLFFRKVSRLSMADIEDVTAEQKGILPIFFNYGVLNIQTAGEMDNFIFPYCPDPNKYATDILEARQEFHNSDE